MAAQKQGDQLERTFSSYVRIQDVVLKTYLGRWTIGRSGERGSGISVLPARYDDDDDDDILSSLFSILFPFSGKYFIHLLLIHSFKISPPFLPQLLFLFFLNFEFINLSIDIGLTFDFATLDGASLKLVDKFTYLGSSVSSTEKDIDTRLTKAWTAIDRLSII